MKEIAILGSTGSIGRQTLEVVDQNKDKFRITALTARNNIELLAEQAKTYQPQYIAVTNEKRYKDLKSLLPGFEGEILAGEKALNEICTIPGIDTVVTAMVGYSGLIPTVTAIKHKKNIALANKETLVVAGEIIMKLAKENNIKILPVDSEHSAIFQSLAGEDYSNIEKIYLTASGGPFRGKTTEELKNVTKEQALKHPNWSMGAKITIDSASMMNKGLEAIEAKWLFNLSPEQVDIIVHPQSVIHSIVQFVDGSMKAQMGLPDMRLPIQYALSYPDRYNNNFNRFNFADYPTLTFEKPDTKVFRNLAIALDAMKKGGNAPCAMNAANEIAVEAFLKDEIKFMDMPTVIEKAIEKTSFIPHPSLDDYILCDKETRIITREIINTLF